MGKCRCVRSRHMCASVHPLGFCRFQLKSGDIYGHVCYCVCIYYCIGWGEGKSCSIDISGRWLYKSRNEIWQLASEFSWTKQVGDIHKYWSMLWNKITLSYFWDENMLHMLIFLSFFTVWQSHLLFHICIQIHFNVTVNVGACEVTRQFLNGLAWLHLLLVYRARPILSLARSWGRDVPRPQLPASERIGLAR